LESVRAAFAALGDLNVDSDPDDLEADFPEAEDHDEIQVICRQAPESYTWIDGDRENGWSGGYVIEIHAVEVEP
jgi:hypothetical protein